MAECANCLKSPPVVGALKQCAKCRATQYCSRDCQKAHWKAHKKTCGKAAGSSSSSSGGAGAGAGTSPSVKKPFTRLQEGSYLKGRPEQEVYGLLIDAYRLRADDDFNLEGLADQSSVYGGAPDSSAAFRAFLARFRERRPEMLPAWWTDDKARECEELGAGPRDDWHSLRRRVRKNDISDRYGDSMLPMQLRMLVEAVYGRGPGGQDGSGMLRMMAMQESGSGPMAGMHRSHLNLAR